MEWKFLAVIVAAITFVLLKPSKSNSIGNQEITLEQLAIRLNKLEDHVTGCGCTNEGVNFKIGQHSNIDQNKNNHRLETLELILGVRGIKVNLTVGELTPSLEWDSGEFYPSELISICTYIPNLKSIKLRNIKLLSAFSAQNRVRLDDLKEFVFDLDRKEFAIYVAFARNEMLDLTEYLDPTGILFFEKGPMQNWPISDISKLKTDIQLSINGEIALELTHDKKELKMIRMPMSFTSQILSNLTFPLEKLEVFSNRFNMSMIPREIKHLNLRMIRTPDETRNTLANILESSHSLIRLCSSYLQNRRQQGEVIQLIHLENKRSLQHLALQYVDINFTPRIKINLQTLYLFECNIEDEILRDFSKIFEAKNIFIYTSNERNSWTLNLLKEILKSEIVESIWMGRVKDDSESEEKALTEFLEIYGIEFQTDPCQIGRETGFILERTSIDETWRGRQLRDLELKRAKDGLCRSGDLLYGGHKFRPHCYGSLKDAVLNYIPETTTSRSEYS